MGLDMYLTKHYYIGGKYDENPDRIIEIPVNKFGRQMNWQFRVGDIENISTLAMQWRKAYSIDD